MLIRVYACICIPVICYMQTYNLNITHMYEVHSYTLCTYTQLHTYMNKTAIVCSVIMLHVHVYNIIIFYMYFPFGFLNYVAILNLSFKPGSQYDANLTLSCGALRSTVILQTCCNATQGLTKNLSLRTCLRCNAMRYSRLYVICDRVRRNRAYARKIHFEI